MNKNKINRRTVLKQFLAGAGTIAATANFGAITQSARAAKSVLSFPQGCASGDPQPDAIVFWTRAVEEGRTSGAVNVRFQVSISEDFGTLVHDDVMSVDETSDYCLRVLLDGLSPDTRYFYRFGTISMDWGPLVGRTRTAPAPDDDRQVRFAFASCQDFKGYYYGAWRRLVEDDKALPEDRQIDFVLHLGDFIYEGAKSFGEGPRDLPPFPSGGIQTPSGYVDALTVDDYRHLYKLYLSDPDLQAARARFPFVCTWDDHEFSNDGWQAHGTYFSPGRSWPDRKAAANQVWFEFIPAILTEGKEVAGENPAADFDGTSFPSRKSGRLVGPLDDDHQAMDPAVRRAVESMTIYRVLSFGRHVDLIITDCRSYRSAHPLPNGVSKTMASRDMVRTLDAGRVANDGNPPETVVGNGKTYPNHRIKDTPGTVLGPQQKVWFKYVLVNSQATWKVWGNSIPLASLVMDYSSVPFVGRDDSISSADGWDGYDTERRELLGYIREQKIANVVSLAGDHHIHMASIIPVNQEARTLQPAIAEFSVASVSSKNFFESFEERTREDIQQFRPVVTFDHTLPDGRVKPMENLNFALTKGIKSAFAMAQTGQIWLAGYFSNSNLNRHLRFVDTASHGFGLVTADAKEMKVDMVCTDNPRTDFGHEGASELYRATFRLSVRDAQYPAPRLQGPDFRGLPPFPYDGWDGTSTKGRRH